MQAAFVLRQRLGAISDSGQKLLRPPLVQVNRHKVCGQSRWLGSDATSQTGQCLSPQADHKPLTRNPSVTGNWEDAGQVGVPSHTPEARTWKGPDQGGRAQREGLTLQTGVGGPLHILHRPRAALTGWATTQLLLHLLPGCREREVRLSLAPGLPPRAWRSLWTPTQKWERAACSMATGQTGREPGPLASLSQVTVGKTSGPGHTREPPHYLRTQSGHSPRGPVYKSPGSPRWMGMWWGAAGHSPG